MNSGSRLFPKGLGAREWLEFNATGFSAPVAGVIYTSQDPPECGVPLGGIDTGCLDLEATGTLGFATIFNSLTPRRGPINLPILGLSIVSQEQQPIDQTWVLTSVKFQTRRTIENVNTYLNPLRYYQAIRFCESIEYWGHYPVVDMEFHTGAPISVGLRAWSPFIPGDIAASNVPAAMFELHLRNPTPKRHVGALTFSFPGPSAEEAATSIFTRREISGDLHGVEVTWETGGYALGVIGQKPARIGGDLGVGGHDWQTAHENLPPVVGQAGSALSVDFDLAPGEEKVIRFVLAWHAPQWMGGGRMSAGGNVYTHMYAARFTSAADTATYMARNGESLLRRILAWQQAIYSDASLPAWLRDALINILHLITEVSVWAQARPPIGDWCREGDGIFGMNECPRQCPQMECIPCSYFGNLPLVYFFPALALSTLRAYKVYQYPTGAVPWVFGGMTALTPPYEMALPSPGYAEKPQTTLDGPCYVEMIDKLWRCSGDDAILEEFYESAKQNTIFTMNLRPGSGDAGVVSMPANNNAYDWYESCDLFGIVPHIGGVHLAQLRMMQRMADAIGDKEFAEQCQRWIEGGSRVMEDHAWAGTHYLLFNELETGKRSDIILAYQLDGEWIARFHGCAGVFAPKRVATTLETLRRTCLAMGAQGAVTFCKPGAQTLDKDGWNPGYWGTKGVHPPGTWVLGMLYMYEGQKELGLDISRQVTEEVMRRGWYWDWPVVVDSARNEHDGYDYYQNLMLWSLPAALAGQDLKGPCEVGGLVTRILAAGRDASTLSCSHGVGGS